MGHHSTAVSPDFIRRPDERHEVTQTKPIINDETEEGQFFFSHGLGLIFGISTDKNESFFIIIIPPVVQTRRPWACTCMSLSSRWNSNWVRVVCEPLVSTQPPTKRQKKWTLDES